MTSTLPHDSPVSQSVANGQVVSLDELLTKLTTIIDSAIMSRSTQSPMRLLLQAPVGMLKSTVVDMISKKFYNIVEGPFIVSISRGGWKRLLRENKILLLDDIDIHDSKCYTLKDPIMRSLLEIPLVIIATARRDDLDTTGWTVFSWCLSLEDIESIKHGKLLYE